MEEKKAMFFCLVRNAMGFCVWSIYTRAELRQDLVNIALFFSVSVFFWVCVYFVPRFCPYKCLPYLACVFVGDYLVIRMTHAHRMKAWTCFS